MSAEKDVFRDDAHILHRLLDDAKIPNKLDFYDDLPHWFHSKWHSDERRDCEDHRLTFWTQSISCAGKGSYYDGKVTGGLGLRAGFVQDRRIKDRCQ